MHQRDQKSQQKSQPKTPEIRTRANEKKKQQRQTNEQTTTPTSMAPTHGALRHEKRQGHWANGKQTENTMALLMESSTPSAK